MSRGSVLGVMLIAAALASEATAAPLLEYTGGFDLGRPLAGRTGPASADAAYFNPARLTADRTRFEAAVVTLVRDVAIDYDPRPAGYDVPASVRDARQITPDGTARLDLRPLPTEALRSARGSHDPAGTDLFLRFGGALPLWPDRLALGFTAVMPLSTFQTQSPFHVDERAQYFDNSLHVERMGDRWTVTTFTTALSLRIIDELSVGAGATLLNDARTVASIYIPDPTQAEIVETNTAVQVDALFAPHLGVLARPLGDDRLTLGATVHFPSEAGVDANSELQFFDFNYPEGQSALFQEFAYTYLSEPLRVGFGASGEVMVADWALEGWIEGTWSRWSTYTDRHGATPADWSDTLDGALGVRASGEADTLAFGLRYAPSPVPEQSGRTNYVDNSRLGLSLGWQHRWTLDTRAVSVGAGLTAQRLLERTHQKRSDATNPVVDELPDAVDAASSAPLVGSAGLQTNNPGFPGFGHGGWLYGVTLSVGVEL